MAQHQYLFQLVKSLLPVEKRYFKLHGKSYFQKEKDGLLYEKLFNAIDKLPNADISDAEFIKANKGASFTTNLSYNKNYLYEKLTQILTQSYTDKNSPDYYLPTLLAELRMFGEKGLEKHAVATATKIIEICEITESYHYLALAGGLISQVITYPERQQNRHLHDIEQKTYQASLRAYAYQQCHAIMRPLTNDKSKTPTQKTALANQLISIGRQYPDSFTIQEAIVRSLSYHYMEKYDYKSAIAVIQKYLSLVEKSKAFSSKYFWTMQNGMGSYTVNLNNLAYMASNTSNLDVIAQVIEKIKPIRKKANQRTSPIPKADLFLYEAKSKLEYYLLKNMPFRASEITAIEHELKQHRKYLPDHYVKPLHFWISLYALSGKNTSIASRHCAEALSLVNKSDYVQSFKFEFEVLTFLVFFAEKETALMRYRLKSLKRLRYNKNEAYQKHILNILEGLYKGIPVKKQITSAYSHVKNGFEREILTCIGKLV